MASPATTKAAINAAMNSARPTPRQLKDNYESRITALIWHFF
jgi:hypothetical protein